MLMVAEQQRMVAITIERTAEDIVTAVVLQVHQHFVRSQKQTIIQTAQQLGQQVQLQSVVVNADTDRIWTEIMMVSVANKHKLAF